MRFMFHAIGSMDVEGGIEDYDGSKELFNFAADIISAGSVVNLSKLSSSAGYL